ncbi:uncharacterized protein LOC117039913 [Lacerta agilis]|uniref:uncharacterized protein LOC117039913 n=1 Tax=Lacerta agilis TaxID=80427 RepID=UPI0014195EB3|nr:uncharacterized protein LOC117039913 [Lacerta agilis]
MMDENSKEEEGRGETGPQPSDGGPVDTSADSPVEGVQGSLSLEEEALAMFDMLEEMEELYEDEDDQFVDLSLAREDDMDALFPMLASALGSEQEDQLHSEITEFDTDEYVEALSSFMGLTQLEDEEHDSEEGEADGGHSTSNAWNKLGQEAIKYFKRAPVFHCMLGTFAADSPVEMQQEEEGRGRGEAGPQLSDEGAAGPSVEPPVEGAQDKEESSSLEEKAQAMFAEPEEMEESHEDADEQLAGMSQAMEADMETPPPTLASSPGKEKVSQLPSECTELDVDEFADALSSFADLNQPEGEEHDREENAGGGALPSSPWNKLRQEAVKYFKRAPVFHYMLGTFATDAPAERPQMKRRQEEEGRGREETGLEPSDGGSAGTSAGPPVAKPKIKRRQTPSKHS